MMPLFLREKSSLKGRWRLETVQDMRSSSSNPVSCSETPIKIYGSKEEIRARKSPETVDAPGFAPDASIPVTLYVNTEDAAGRRRLRQIAKQCVNYGQRVQNSVFECLLDTAQCRSLQNTLCKIMDPKRDSLRFYYLGKQYEKKIEHFGCKQTYLPEDTLII